MAIESRLLGWRDDAVDQMYITFSVAASTVINASFTTSHTFSRAFTATPKVIGVVGAKMGTFSVVAVSTAMSLYVRGLSPTTFGDETVLYNVTLEGKY